jgi:hypothetical protein
MARKAVVLPLAQPGSVESADRVLAQGDIRAEIQPVTPMRSLPA